MLDHVSITVSDLSRAARFYDAIFEALGVPCVVRTAERVGYGERNGPDDAGRTYLSIRESPNVVADRRHWCFAATDRARVRAFYAAGLEAGGRDDGPPGLRAYHDAYYAAFLLDPDGNRVEAVCHARE